MENHTQQKASLLSRKEKTPLVSATMGVLFHLQKSASNQTVGRISSQYSSGSVMKYRPMAVFS